MRSAQRKKRIENIHKKSRIYGLLIKVFVPLLLILSIILYLKLTTKNWNGTDKMSFVFPEGNGDVQVVVLDPALNEETTLIIPGDTEVTVARGYGTIRVKNVWQLGMNEKLGGALLAQTVTEQFLFPTNLWNGHGLNNVWSFIFGSKKTNISFGDRLFAGLFAMKVKGIDKTQIDLAKSQFLTKQTLTDGKLGYVVNGVASGRLTVYFSDNEFGDKNLKFTIIDSTNKFGVADGVGTILEVLGGKVVAVDKKAVNDSLDCSVSGQNSDAVQKVARLFYCKVTRDTSNFDLEMRIGGRFAKRF